VTSRIAIIPARGGSKRIPQKNIRNFCGKPIISYPLAAARDSQLFGKIHVSTDSQDIVDVVNELGFNIDFLRPVDLADDFTPIMPVLKFVLEEYARAGEIFDEVWLLMPCAPLFSAWDLVEASGQYSAESKKSLQCIVEYPVPIEWAYDRNEDKSLKPLNPGMFAVRSQDIPKKYYDAGAFYIFPYDTVLNSTGAGTDSGYLGFLLPKSKVIDIDDQDDWAIAEALFLANQGTRKQ